MDESQKKKSFDAVVAAVNMAAMGAGIAAAFIAASKNKAAGADPDKIEKSISELNEKFDRISEQLKSMHPEVGTATRQAEKKPESAQQHGKPQQEVIYVRKSTEFSFYN